MSSTAQSDDGRSILNEEIAQDFSVCSNCFNRTYVVHAEFEPRELKKSLRGVLKNDVEKTNSAVTDYHQSYSVSQSRSTHCGECGSDRSLILKRPLRMDTALEYGENLAERINEVERYSVEQDELLAEIERLKQQPGNQRESNWVFHQSLKNTIKTNAN